MEVVDLGGGGRLGLFGRLGAALGLATLCMEQLSDVRHLVGVEPAVGLVAR